MTEESVQSYCAVFIKSCVTCCGLCLILLGYIATILDMQIVWRFVTMAYCHWCTVQLIDLTSAVVMLMWIAVPTDMLLLGIPEHVCRRGSAGKSSQTSVDSGGWQSAIPSWHGYCWWFDVTADWFCWFRNIQTWHGLSALHLFVCSVVWACFVWGNCWTLSKQGI